MFRIGIDGRALQVPMAGVARYQVELCRELDSILTDAEFFLYSKRPVPLPVDSPRWHARVDPWPFAPQTKSVIWQKLRLGHLSRPDGLDLFWSPDPFLPRLARTIPLVATVLDLNSILVPETMHPAHRWAHQLFLRRDLRRAQAVIAISQGTRVRLLEHTGIEAVAVIPPAVSSFFRDPGPERQRQVCAKFGLHVPYLLAVATLEPRKNLAALLEAFRLLRGRDHDVPLELALAGAWGWRNGDLSKQIADLEPLGLRALGRVPDADLPALYAGCRCFVFPSRYEGFGLPVLEARACGAAVVTTDIPELREAGGAVAVYTQPTAEGILRGLDLAAARPRVAVADQHLPSWRDSAMLLAKLFRVLVPQPRA